MTAPETRPSLLLRLQNPADQQAWSEFWQVYEPLVIGLVRKRGLQDADAREVAQDVLLAVSQAIDRWDATPERGSFRGWLATITRNLVVNFLIRQARHPRGSGDSNFQLWLEAQPSPERDESRWFDREERWHLFRWAAQEVRRECRDTTWRAFWETAVEGREAADVARELDVQVGVVYVARSRVMKRLREKVEAVRGRPPTGSTILPFPFP
ncbi:MAG: sigma-70 family RNA polymerase sigma factor [Pirellulales bacterium]